MRAGEIHGFLGPDGAGKTTTTRVVLGLMRADGGRARLLGGDPWAAAIAEPDRSDAALLLEGVVLGLQAGLRWLETCEQNWIGRRSG